jgi:hypothetical protein
MPIADLEELSGKSAPTKIIPKIFIPLKKKPGPQKFGVMVLTFVPIF